MVTGGTKDRVDKGREGQLMGDTQKNLKVRSPSKNIYCIKQFQCILYKKPSKAFISFLISDTDTGYTK